MSNRLDMSRMNRNLRKPGHDQRERRQHDHDHQIDDREREREIAPDAELHHAGAECLAGDRDVAAPAHHLLLQEDQEAGDDHQDDRDRGGGGIERRRPVGELEDVGGQHRDVAGRAEHRRNAVDAEHHDERQQHAGDDRRRDQRERHGEQDAHRAAPETSAASSSAGSMLRSATR
jgi:hypothetical protein